MGNSHLACIGCSLPSAFAEHTDDSNCFELHIVITNGMRALMVYL